MSEHKGSILVPGFKGKAYVPEDDSPTRRDAPPSLPPPPEGLPEEIASFRDKIRITFERRPDGGLRVYSDELPGLVLSHAEHAAVLADLRPAIESLLSHHLSAARARAERAEKALAKLTRDLQEDRAIRI